MTLVFASLTTRQFEVWCVFVWKWQQMLSWEVGGCRESFSSLCEKKLWSAECIRSQLRGRAAGFWGLQSVWKLSLNAEIIYTFPHYSSLPFSLLNCDCPASATLRILSPLPKGTNEFVCIRSLSSEVKRHFADLTWWNKLHESISIFVLLNFTSWSASSKHSFPPPLHVWPPIRTTTHKYPAIVWCSALFRAWVTVKKKIRKEINAVSFLSPWASHYLHKQKFLISGGLSASPRCWFPGSSLEEATCL